VVEFVTNFVVKILVDVDVNDELVEVKFDCKMFFTLLIKGYFPFKFAKLILNIIYFKQRSSSTLPQNEPEKSSKSKVQNIPDLLMKLYIFSLYKFTARK